MLRALTVALLLGTLSSCTCGAPDDEPTLPRRDAGTQDAGTQDAGTSDAGALDAGSLDAGTSDAGASDAGSFDAGTSDAGDDECRCDWATPGHSFADINLPCGASLCTGPGTGLRCDPTGVPLEAACGSTSACQCTDGTVTLDCGTRFCTGLARDSGVDTEPVQRTGHGWSCSDAGALTELPSCTFVY